MKSLLLQKQPSIGTLQIVFLKNFAKYKEKHLFRSLQSLCSISLIWDSDTGIIFSVFCQIFKPIIFIEHFQRRRDQKRRANDIIIELWVASLLSLITSNAPLLLSFLRMFVNNSNSTKLIITLGNRVYFWRVLNLFRIWKVLRKRRGANIWRK